MPPLSLAQQERTTLCDLLLECGPNTPTLCEGWSTADLAAHLVAREVLAAYDDALSFWMNAILGDEWDEGELDEARQSWRRRAG